MMGFKRQVIYGRDGVHGTPYMKRYAVGRLMLHIFYRGDEDPDPHDHPWDFWTFPLTSYVEEVPCGGAPGDWGYDVTDFTTAYPHVERRIVRAFRLHRRRAEHVHRVLGRHNSAWRGPVVREGRIITLVWHGYPRRKHRWGFWVNDCGVRFPDAIFRRWTFVSWRDYVYGRKT